MSVNGIWNVEMLGPYGWEAVATAFLEDGVYRSASENHYSVGTYKVTGNQLRMSSDVVQHGRARTVFGRKEKNMKLSFEGKIKGDVIKGQTRDGKKKYQITSRLTRLADL